MSANICTSYDIGSKHITALTRRTAEPSRASDSIFFINSVLLSQRTDGHLKNCSLFAKKLRYHTKSRLLYYRFRHAFVSECFKACVHGASQKTWRLVELIDCLVERVKKNLPT